MMNMVSLYRLSHLNYGKSIVTLVNVRQLRIAKLYRNIKKIRNVEIQDKNYKQQLLCLWSEASDVIKITCKNTTFKMALRLIKY